MSETTPPNPALPSLSTVEYYRPMEVFVVKQPREHYWLHILLLLITIFTTLVVGARMQFNFNHGIPNFTAGNEWMPFFPIEWILAAPRRLLLGIPFSATLLFILLAHEMGHYVFCRYYGVRATLPFFIPAPTLIGTLGAVIRIKSPIRSRAALFDIGIAGPIAGFVVAVVTLFVALILSKPAGAVMGHPDLELGYPLIFHVVHRLLPNSIPLSQMALHPVGVAAWVGMFATALNLLPSGQLDGGHMVYALWPRAHRVVSWIVVLVLVYLGWHFVGWRLWAALVAAMNILSWRQHQAPDYPGIRGFRLWLALLGLVMLVLTFTIVPFHGEGFGWK
ncbi:MAG TPA: site-2 protease family protein [Terriglobales bacterium]|jgi:membrane-associated protease RseP (regulator of RpoE activity)|nr:site-2 protease family protein [Terriglobales bacterium]